MAEHSPSPRAQLSTFDLNINTILFSPLFTSLPLNKKPPNFVKNIFFDVGWGRCPTDNWFPAELLTLALVGVANIHWETLTRPQHGQEHTHSWQTQALVFFIVFLDNNKKIIQQNYFVVARTDLLRSRLCLARRRRGCLPPLEQNTKCTLVATHKHRSQPRSSP